MKTCLKIALATIAIVGLLASVGCIRSRLIITTDPPGADVTFHHEDYGRTPVTIPFIWYWWYDVEITKEGFETVVAEERLRCPPWFIFPLDGFFEILPIQVTDTRRRHYTLTPTVETQP
jgi:PEGA domain